MNKEQLQALGLTEEQITGVLDAHKETMTGFIPKARFDEVNEKKKQLEGDVAERDSQLESLKAINPEELQAQITALQDSNKASTEAYEAKLHEQAYGFAMTNALTSAKVRNHKALQALLNNESIKLEDGKLTGLDEQLSALKESDSYLFEVEAPAVETPPAQEGFFGNAPAPKFTTGGHANEGGGDAFSNALFGK
ncbi:phage scaffolding protein [Bacillus paranthracis]|uniref:phage scaffolding protein n=1 Tax=Bacillus paranthracis TaxID=2026186 RepID=UPI003D653977